MTYNYISYFIIFVPWKLNKNNISHDIQGGGGGGRKLEGRSRRTDDDILLK